MDSTITRSLNDLDHLIRKYLSDGKDPRKYLNYTQMRVMVYLIAHQDEETCQKDLEVETNLKKASITAVIDNLEDRGFVKRTESKEDKRRNIIELTEKSKEIRNNFDDRLKKLEKLMAKDIAEEDLKVFHNVISKMEDNVRKAD